MGTTPAIARVPSIAPVGNVFCTKSKPNCNACPMRAECKHFASAFASARLALPAPEQKGIVSSNVPFTTSHNTFASFNPMNQPLPLPIPEVGVPFEPVPRTNNHEPIIEVPASPESHDQCTTESDFEDTFYEEDPDEIPTIKLNIEDFALNLQNYMQANMELQEGDMSKALVALTPEVASIPTPKLKNVTRLRTEHQVICLRERIRPEKPCSSSSHGEVSLPGEQVAQGKGKSK
ncbi:hypothetical protein Scep_005364 [Stephania cephalantha]|uniref:Uncharacterized protein n=1 Tax=Stephania cephalantha TaxID=152367 RepID=A0AAP0KWR6_9MAGN